METPTLVFVPGFMQRGDAWAPVAGELAERYPSVLLDHPDDLPPAATLPVGYSMGGRIVLHTALDQPGRWPRIVLVGVSAGVPDPAERRARDEQLAAWIESHTIEEVVERWESQPVFASQTAELRERQRSGRLAHDPAELARLLRERGQGAMAPVWERLPGLEAEVLLLAGEFDETYVAAGRRMAELLPAGRFEAVEGAGHAPQLEAPTAVAEAIRAFVPPPR